MTVSAIGKCGPRTFLRRTRHRGFSIMAAAINCIHRPLGTAPGIFTLVGVDA
jgi:hypothetical protein